MKSKWILPPLLLGVSQVASTSDRTAPTGWRRRVPNEVRHFVAAAGSGAAGVTLLAPLEVIRVNMMLNKESFRDTVSTLQSGWFRGNSADVVAAALRVGVTMPTFSAYKRALVRVSGVNEAQPVPRWVSFSAGALAGCTSAVLCFPFEVIRTRLAAGCYVTGGLAGCMIDLAESEGMQALFSGLSTTLLGVLPFNAIKLCSYDALRAKAIAWAHSSERVGAASAAVVDITPDSISLPVSATAAIGAIAGVLAATSCFPLEVVRRRQMMGEFYGLSMLKAFQTVVGTEGFSVLLAGAHLNMLKVGLSNSIGFVLYEVRSSKSMLLPA